ncbi:hypothetical protein ACFL2R_00030 [Patescibacteria group bacterium]
MFKLVKTILLLIGLFVATGFILNYLGYEVNQSFFQERKDECHEKLNECKNDLIKNGIDNVQCDFKCVDPKLIIKEKK